MRKVLTSLPLLACSVLIYCLSDQPKPIFVDVEFALKDKVMHFIGYFCYGMAAQVLLIGWFGNRAPKWHRLMALTIGMAFGFSDEFHQSFIPGRSTEFADWIADALGTAASLLLYKRIHKIINTDKDGNEAIRTDKGR